MAWGLDHNAIGALQSWGFRLVAYKLYETKPLSDSQIGKETKAFEGYTKDTRKHLRDIVCKGYTKGEGWRRQIASDRLPGQPH